jgi:hypothetical protein
MLPSLFGKPSELNPFSYAHNNPINLIDPLGLQSSNSCEEDDGCPCGEWEGSSFLGVAVFPGGGFSIDSVFWSCTCGDAFCEAVYLCFGGGAIAEASIAFVGTCKANGAFKKRDLVGMSKGFRASAYGGSGIKTYRGDTTIECWSGGAGVGGGVTFAMTCVTLSTTCD